MNLQAGLSLHKGAGYNFRGLKMYPALLLMSCFWHKREYHEKYHVQKLLLILTGNIEKQPHAVLQASAHHDSSRAQKLFFRPCDECNCCTKA
jgi:hypothetical protein